MCQCHNTTFCPDEICIGMDDDVPIFVRRDSPEGKLQAARDAAQPMIEYEIRRDERERCARLLEARARQLPGGVDRAGFLLAATTVRRGRLMTVAEQLENLFAAVNDEPAPHPAPTTAV